MLELLTEEEKEIMLMLIRGQNFNGISEWLGIDYAEYVKIKKSLLKKMGINRITKLLPEIIENGVIFDEL